jgi:transglutaminase-like putative cysteine protease
MPEIGQSFNWDRFQGPFVTEEPPPVSYYIINPKSETKYEFETEQGPLCVAPNAAQRQVLKTVPPEIDPRVVELARRVAKNGTTYLEKSALIVDYLFKNNSYSLEFERSAGDPVSDFVLSKKAAHCQYFASASVIMLRAVGIPARYVTGYYANELAEDGATVVRGRDAHAWTEAYIQNIGWVVLDATPPNGRADPQVNPTPWYQKTLEKAQDNFARVRAWFARLTQIQIFGIVLGIFALWGAERFRQNLKNAKKRAVIAGAPPEFAPLARRFERVLGKRGLTVSEGRPWSETVPDELENERDWIGNYNRARFDEKNEEITELERELQKLEK